MYELYFANKWKSQIYDKIIKRMSKISNSQRSLTILDIHKVGY